MPSDESTGDAISGHVFISHHSAQHEAARQVKAALAAAGIGAWLAPDDVDPGSAFDLQIIAAIGGARAMVLLLDAEADRSRHVKREVMLADDGGVPVYPVRLEPVQAEGLAYWLKEQQWIDWLGGKGDGLDRLVAAIEGKREMPPYSVPVARKGRRLGLVALAAAVGLLAVGLAAWLLVPGLAERDTYVRPGLWINKREMIAITFPRVTNEAAQQIKETLENDPNPEECIEPTVARQPDVNLFDPGNKGRCVLSGFQIGNGRMSGYLNCPLSGAKNGMVLMAFRGTYTPTSIVMDSDITMTQPVGTLKFKARDSSHWVADKCNADNR